MTLFPAIDAESYRVRLRTLESNQLLGPKHENITRADNDFRLWAFIHLIANPHVGIGFDDDFVLNFGGLQVDARIELVRLFSAAGRGN